MEKQEKQQELINNIKNGDDCQSFKRLLDDYEPLIKSLSWKICNTYKNTPITREDLENVLSFGFLDLTRNFDVTRGKSFPAYIKQQLLYKGLNYLRLYITNGHKTLNFSVDDTMLDRGEAEVNQNDLIDFLLDPSLDNVEYKVIESTIDGKHLKEIAEEMHKSKQTVYLIKKRAIEKIKKNIFSNI